MASSLLRYPSPLILSTSSAPPPPFTSALRVGQYLRCSVTTPSAASVDECSRGRRRRRPVRCASVLSSQSPPHDSVARCDTASLIVSLASPPPPSSLPLCSALSVLPRVCAVGGGSRVSATACDAPPPTSAKRRWTATSSHSRHSDRWRTTARGGGRRSREGRTVGGRRRGGADDRSPPLCPAPALLPLRPPPLPLRCLRRRLSVGC